MLKNVDIINARPNSMPNKNCIKSPMLSVYGAGLDKNDNINAEMIPAFSP